MAVIDELNASISKHSGITDPPQSEMDTVTINGYEYIGYINIPDLSLYLPVMSEWSYDGTTRFTVRCMRADGYGH